MYDSVKVLRFEEMFFENHSLLLSEAHFVFKEGLINGGFCGNLFVKNKKK